MKQKTDYIPLAPVVFNITTLKPDLGDVEFSLSVYLYTTDSNSNVAVWYLRVRANSGVINEADLKLYVSSVGRYCTYTTVVPDKVAGLYTFDLTSENEVTVNGDTFDFSGCRSGAYTDNWKKLQTAGTLTRMNFQLYNFSSSVNLDEYLNVTYRILGKFSGTGLVHL